MYLEVKNNHPMYEAFIGYVKDRVPDVEIRKYEVATYVNAKDTRLINFLSCLRHDLIMVDKDEKGDLFSFPIDLFGTIYEM